MNPKETEKTAGKTITRRNFLRGTAGAMAMAGTAASYNRVLGANDRIRIGEIGCSARAFGHREMLKNSMKKHPNIEIASVCDIWSTNLDKAADHVKQMFGNTPKKFKYSEDLLADRDLDAVMIGTGDHQHARIMAEVVKAGKDVYCEKPMANTLEDAKLARTSVLESSQVAQMGSQWLSCPYHRKVRDIIRSGKLGKITKVEQSWNFNGPRWYVPKDPDIAAIREEDTDWERWLLGRPWRPFDPRVYFEFRIFKNFSGGITDQWYSHASGLTHFFLDTLIPDDTVANGGIFAWHDVRENPDTFQCLSTFQSKEVLYSYCSSYGNYYGDHTIIRGTEGTLYSPGGEGSPLWYFKPEMKSAWATNVVFDHSDRGEAKAEMVTLEDGKEPPVKQDDNLSAHTDNWLDCIKSRKRPHGSIETGFAHSVAIIMATKAYRDGCKVYWDREKEEIVESPPRSRRG